MIIDTHTHFYDPTRPQGIPWPPANNKLLYRPVQPEHHRALAEPEGVTGTVVVEASVWLEDNQYILDLAAHDPWIVGMVGNISPDRPEFGADLDRFAANPLFRGIRVRTGYFEDVEQGSFLADMEKLASLDLEADVLIRKQHVDGLLALARRLPELRIVIDHICHMPIDGAAGHGRVGRHLCPPGRTAQRLHQGLGGDGTEHDPARPGRTGLLYPCAGRPLERLWRGPRDLWQQLARLRARRDVRAEHSYRQGLCARQRPGRVGQVLLAERPGRVQVDRALDRIW